MPITLAVSELPQAIGWRAHDGRACPTSPLALVKVQFRGESIEEAEAFPARPAFEWDWMLPVRHRDIVAWRYADELTLLQRLRAHVGPWFDGMASPFMQRFITGALILAVAMFVALLVMVNL